MIRESTIPDSTIIMEYKTNFHSNKRNRAVKNNKKPYCLHPSKLPRITRLLALAHHLQGLIDRDIVRDYADIARLSGLSRARLSQIMNLALLAPPIQEEIILAPAQIQIPDYMRERALRMVLKATLWEEQLKIWEGLKTLKLKFAR